MCTNVVTINIPREVSPFLLPAALEAGSVLAHETSGTCWAGSRSMWIEQRMGGDRGECGYSHPTFERELNGAGPARAQHPERYLLLHNVCCGYCKYTEGTWSLCAERRDPIPSPSPSICRACYNPGSGQAWVQTADPDHSISFHSSLLEGMEGKGLCSQPLLSPGPLGSPHTDH